MSEVDEILYRKSGKVGIITLNRAPANAYYLGFLALFHDRVKEAIDDCDVNVVVVESSSEKFFCAGADIKIFQSNSTEENAKMVDQARLNMALIEESGKIFIAAVGGHCLGGGLEIALTCDFRWAAEGQYLFGLPEINLGLIPGNGGSQRLTRVVGVSAAMEMLVTGDPIQPERALQIGLVNRLVAKDELKKSVYEYAEKIANGPGRAIAATKKAVNGGVTLDMKDALALEASLVEELYETHDAAEGFKAFVEKRKPVFLSK